MIHPPHTRFRRGLSWPGLSALEVRLMVFIVAAIALTALLQGFLAYRNALAQADALFDYQMQQTAYALRAGLPIDARGHPQGTRPEDESNELIVQVWTNEGLRIFESALGDSLPQMAVLGFADIPARGTTYRVFSLQTRSQVIQIAQDMRVRQALARDAAWRSLLPIALGHALSVALVVTMTGFYLVWVRGSQLGPASNLSISLNGLLIVVFALLAWRSARARDFAAHRRHALRAYLLVNGVWFLRIGIMLTGLVLAPLGIKIDYTGAPFILVSFGSWMVPMAVLALYFQAERSRHARVKVTMGALLCLLALLTLAGSAAAIAFMWWPVL